MCEACWSPQGHQNYYSNQPNFGSYIEQLAKKQSALAEAAKTKRKKLIYKEEKMPEIEVVKTGGVEKELMLFRVERVTDGLRIRARSSSLAKFFDQYKSPPAVGEPQVQKVTKWGNLGVLRMDKFPTVENATFERPGDLPIVNEYIVNLSFLRAEKLGEGVDFTIKGVFSRSQAESFYNAARAAIKELFMEYLESTDFEFTLTGRSSL